MHGKIPLVCRLLVRRYLPVTTGVGRQRLFLMILSLTALIRSSATEFAPLLRKVAYNMVDNISNVNQPARFYYCPGSCSLASQIALEEAEISYTPLQVDLMGDRGDYWEINPSGKVPALIVDGRLVTENVAILSLCAQMNPHASLMPTAPLDYASCLAFLAWCSNTAHIARRQARVPKRFSPDTAIHASLQRAGREMFATALDTIEERLAGGPWILGDNYSVCDIYAMVFYDWGLTDGHAMTSRKWYTTLVEKMRNRPGVALSLEMHNSPILSV